MKDETSNKNSTNNESNEKEIHRFVSTTSDVPKSTSKASDCITDNNWLRSDDIDCFGEKLAFRHQSSYTYGFAPSYLYEWAAKRNFNSLLTYMHMFNIKQNYSFFVPVINSLEQGNHWFLACVVFLTKTIMIMDPIRKTIDKNYYRQHFMNICDLVTIAMESAGGQPDFENWKLVVDSECYQQKNDFDCGIFVCLYMYSIMNKDYGYLSRLRKNRRDVVRRVLDEYPLPPMKIEHRYNCQIWQSYPCLEYTYEKGSIVIANLESALKAKCIMCKEKIEGSKTRCIVCGTEAHNKCLLPDDVICFCEMNRHHGTPVYKHPSDEE